MSQAESAIRAILQNPLDHDGWVVQGLGMLRLPLNDDRTERLHIWDPNLVLNDTVSAHDHPWDLDAQVYFGRMGNQRYKINNPTGLSARGSSVVCGVGGYLFGDTFDVTLAEACEREVYEPGQAYHMEAEEFHDSFPEPGTVTVIKKGLRPERSVATILWVGNEDWRQEGFTREATKDEILHFVGLVSLQ